MAYTIPVDCFQTDILQALTYILYTYLCKFDANIKSTLTQTRGGIRVKKYTKTYV